MEMEKVGLISIEDAFKKMTPKESVMIRYTSTSYVGIAFYTFVKTLKQIYDDRVGIVIVDMLDNLSVVKYQAEAFGINVENILSGALVMKVGGSSDIGHVKWRLDISPSYLIHRERFKEQLDSLMRELSNKEFIVIITLGMDKFLMLLDKRERLLYTHDIVKTIAMKETDVRDIFFINADLWAYLEPYVSKYFEEAVLFIADIVDPHHLRIVKAPTNEFRGKVIEF